jgi:hypothetical protein
MSTPGESDTVWEGIFTAHGGQLELNAMLWLELGASEPRITVRRTDSYERITIALPADVAGKLDSAFREIASDPHRDRAIA